MFRRDRDYSYLQIETWDTENVLYLSGQVLKGGYWALGLVQWYSQDSFEWLRRSARASFL